MPRRPGSVGGSSRHPKGPPPAPARDERVKRVLLTADVLSLAPTTALFLVYPVPPPLFVFGKMTFLLPKRSGPWRVANTGLIAAGRKKRDRHVFARASLRLRQSLFCLASSSF